MLVFWRPAFRSGVLIIKDLDENGKPMKHILKPTDNGKVFDKINSEQFVCDCYPHWFMTQEEYNTKRAEYYQTKAQKKDAVIS
jgi:hypothetical protein